VDDAMTAQGGNVTPRYIVEQTPEGRWIIVNSRDPQGLVWAGSHWASRETTGAYLISFTSFEAAENYARKVLDQ
jgi:hypothetical protein